MNERNIVMKKILLFVIMVVITLPMSAQNTQEWKSTSIMQTSGSTYSPQVTAVGAQAIPSTATTTETYNPTQNGPRRGYDANGNWTPDSDDFGGGAETGGATNEFPIGDAVLPLMALAMVYGVWSVVYRRKRRA